MKKADLAELARLGVRTKLEAIQTYLADVFDDFPEVFTSATPPIFLRPQEKPGGNSWPTDAHTLISSNGSGADAVLVPAHTRHKVSWTPARRAEQAARVRRQNLKRTGKWGDLGWHRIYELLKNAPKHSLHLSQIAKALKMPDTSVRSAFGSHTELFTAVGRGEYRLKRLLKPSERITTPQPGRKQKGGSKPKKERKWGMFVWQRIYDYLMTVENRTAPLNEMMKSTKVNSQATAITSMDSHKDLFKRVSPGVYTLTKELTDEQRQ
jgi:hypothetical protein